MNINLKKCALCGSDDKLELSHIVPKMAVRALKKSSVGAIRSAENPDQTVQDRMENSRRCIVMLTPLTAKSARRLSGICIN